MSTVPERIPLDSRAALGALAFAFSDIATAPLYALNGAFGKHGVAATPEHVVGVLSLVVWALVLVVCLKLLAFVLRADNNGEGGIMALLVLARRALLRSQGLRTSAVWLGLAGAALLVAHAVVVPALGIRAAAAGLGVAGELDHSGQIGASIALIALTVLLQRRSLFGAIRIFGVLMGLWLGLIAVLGAVAIARQPAILAALNPARAVEFLGANGTIGFAVLLAVALVLAGADALYAELGRFGARSLRLLWYALVLPALLLSYFGQGAELLSNPDAAATPFFGTVDAGWMLPVTVLAIAVAMIASRAMICGTAALLREAAQLGFLPRIKVIRTSCGEREHIHIPGLNLVLLALAAGAVLMLRTPQELGAACALAATGAMTITTVLAAIVAYWQWHWRPLWLVPLVLLFGLIDLALLGASVLQFLHGGWYALMIALALVTLMLTWRRGRDLLLQKTATDTLPLESFCSSIAAHPPNRIDLTAIFLTARPDKVPQALLNNLKYNHVLHARNVILTVVTVDEPTVQPEERLQLTDLGNGFFRLQLSFGFAEEVDVPLALRRHAPEEWRLGASTTAYFLGRDEIETVRPGMRPWRDRLFAFMARNATPAHAYFRIPSNQLIEIGVRWQL